MKHTAGLFVCLALTVLCLSASVHAQSKAEQKIIAVLSAQLESWNKGDIEGFMKTYWKDDSLMFIGKSGVTYGWYKTLTNYQKGYPDKTAMGQLDFTILSVKKVSARMYSVVGKWHLARQIGDLQGHFTLLIKKIKKEWLIIQDHSS